LTDVRDHWWWRPGWRPGRRFFTFHVIFADQPEVQALAASARTRLAGLPGLDLVPAQWLHLTMQGIGFSDEVADDDLAKIIAAAREQLAAVPPVTVRIGPVVVADEGVACWAGPAGTLDPMRDAVRAAIGDVWGTDRVLEAAAWTPHVSVAYASADGPGDQFETALNGLDDVAEATLRAADLIKLGRDQHVYEWESLERFPLGGLQLPNPGV
jgi:2'-5' RNA ligase